MSEISSRKTVEEEEQISDCENHSEELTDWECKFIDDISKYDVLTLRQREVLQKIWNKVTH
jgi:hypothetical protein